MLFKCVVLLVFVLGSIDGSYYSDSESCPTPRLEHGRVRRQRSRLVRFVCSPRYTLVGNKYATCQSGRWDVPPPVCVRASCPVPQFPNGLRMLSYGGAWVIFFCMPNFEMVGSPVIYCNGHNWNASAPVCVDSTSPPNLSCDFEDVGLCGWKQDELHDFDWLRINSKTPSSFMFTGPSYDHTLGEGNNGHYMYIESTSRSENDTARLVSPVYDSALTANGCFSFSYHMYGKTTGGLRVYQKPDNMTLRGMLDLGQGEKRSYLLFEKWGNLGDFWFNSVSTLKTMSIDFQIVIEGIRGSSYTSDIAVDDVAILQGENCTEAAKTATTPTIYLPDSCVGRCVEGYEQRSKNDTRCSCSVSCFIDETCCPDFFDACIFLDGISESTVADTSVVSSNEPGPQTLKLVAGTTESTTTSTTTTTTITPLTSTISTTTKRSRPVPPKPTLRTTRKSLTSTSTSISTSTTSTTPTTIPTTRLTTRKPEKTTKKPSTIHQTTSKRTTKTIPPKTDVVPLSRTTPSTTNATISNYKVSKPIDNDNYLESVEKKKKEEEIESRKVVHESVTNTPKPSGMSSGAKATLIILVLVMLTACAAVARAGLRSARGQIALARLRGRREGDPEVRYLPGDVDDD